MPLFNSCDKPSGDPEKDAQNNIARIEKRQKLEIEYLEKLLEAAKYYAEKGDYKGYQKFRIKLNRLESKVAEDVRTDHRDEYRDIENRQESINNKIYEINKEKIDDNNPYNDDYDIYY